MWLSPALVRDSRTEGREQSRSSRTGGMVDGIQDLASAPLQDLLSECDAQRFGLVRGPSTWSRIAVRPSEGCDQPGEHDRSA